MRSVARLAVALPLVLAVGACAAPAGPTPATSGPAASAAVAESSPTPAASVAVRPSPFPGAPSIAEPYWLLHKSHTKGQWTTEATGEVIRVDEGESYEVVNGGSLEGTVLVNGTVVASLNVTTTTGEAATGLTPIEEQYGALITSVRPGGWSRGDQNWTRRTGTWGTTQVWIREPKASVADFGISAHALYWIDEGSTWANLQVNDDGDVDAALAALLGPEA